jgi:hypothetical protein
MSIDDTVNIQSTMMRAGTALTTACIERLAVE